MNAPHKQGVIVVLAEPPAYNSPNKQMKWSEELRETLLGNIITCADEPFVTSSKNIAGGGTLAPDCLHFLINTGTALRKWAAQHKRLDWEALLEPREQSAPARATNALAAQVGGDHYKNMAIQPVEYIHRNGIGFIEGCVIKYVSRWRAKNGIQDLEKARHFINLLIELESKK